MRSSDSPSDPRPYAYDMVCVLLDEYRMTSFFYSRIPPNLPIIPISRRRLLIKCFQLPLRVVVCPGCDCIVLYEGSQEVDPVR